MGEAQAPVSSDIADDRERVTDELGIVDRDVRPSDAALTGEARGSHGIG
jgi:hypothetical protein